MLLDVGDVKPLNGEEEFAMVDQWAAEAYLTALDAGEPGLLALLNGGVKIHNWMLEKTTKEFPNEVSLAGYNYHKAKQTVHALNYGVMENKMSMESNLPLYVCQWQRMMYHNQFPAIKFRQERIRSELLKYGCLTSILGRKKVFFSKLNDETLNKAYAWPSQSCIGELTNIALVNLMKVGQVLQKPWMLPALNTHDGLVIRVKKNTRGSVREAVRNAFRIPLEKNKLRIIIPIELCFGPNFNDVEKDSVEVIRYGNS